MTPEEWLEFHFSRCWPWLDEALNASPMRTHDKEHIWEGLLSGELQLWPTPNSASVVQITTYPTGLKVLHGLLAGGDLKEIQQTAEVLEQYAIAQGCHFVAPQGREGWLRALKGYRRAYTVMAKDLR